MAQPLVVLLAENITQAVKIPKSWKYCKTQCLQNPDNYYIQWHIRPLTHMVGGLFLYRVLEAMKEGFT